jgi:hypothetical protein
MKAFFRPIKSPTLLPIRMKAADTSASSAMADCTPLTVVSRSLTTAEIDTFITEVSTTRTNMAAASSKDSRWLRFACLGSLVFVVSLISNGPFPERSVPPTPRL